VTIQHINLVFQAEGLNPTEKLVLLAYCNYTDPHGYVWAGVDRIAADTGASPRTVKRVRAALRARGLLATKRRVNPRTGESIPNLTRINLALLESMRRTPREYDDNLVENLTFDEEPSATPEETASDLRMGQSDPRSNLRRGQSDPGGGVKLTPPYGGVKLAPNPSVHPSESSSSSGADRSQAADSTSHGTKRRTSPPETLIVEECGATPEEAAALVDHIRRQGEAKRSLSGYVRHLVANGDMAERLRSLRAARAVPTSRHPADERRCGLHRTPMSGGDCSSCAGDIKAGDAADVVAYYLSLTPEERDTRADLKRLLESRGLIESEGVAV